MTGSFTCVAEHLGICPIVLSHQGSVDGVEQGSPGDCCAVLMYWWTHRVCTWTGESEG